MPVSFYDGWRAFEAALEALERRREREVRAVLESRAYRLGRALTWPALTSREVSRSGGTP